MYRVNDLFEIENPRTFIVAEIGINHEGKFEFAKKFIEKAKECGADAVKFQVFQTENFYNPLIAREGYEIFKKYELGFDEFFKLKEFANSLDLVFFATPLDLKSLAFLDDIDCPIIKLASSDITCEPFLYKVSETASKSCRAIFLSTGFVKMERVKTALRFFRKNKIALLYCVSKYPATEDDIDLNVITRYRETFFVPVGFSDHTMDYIFAVGAVVLGAKIIEKHFTVDKSLKGADHSISMDPENFSKMVKEIRKIEKSLKSGEKEVTEFEKEISELSMRGLYYLRDIKKGEKIREEDIAFLRPGKGIKIKEYFSIIGKKANQEKKKYEKI